MTMTETPVPPAEGQQQLPGVVEEPTPVLTLVRDFTEKEGCDSYSTDSKKIDLMLLWIWLRQFTEGLTFETFLEKFARVADFNAENRKHPEDALKFHCPRAAKVAEKLGKPQWNAKECVGILSLYVDLCRLADAEGLQPGEYADLDAYLEMDGPAVKSGEVKLPETPKKGRKAKPKAGDPAPADPDTGLVPTNNPIRPTGPGQRIVYSMESEGGRQIRGQSENVFEDGGRWYVTFIADTGERWEAVNQEHCTLLDEPPPPVREDVVETKTLWIPKATAPQVTQALALTGPMGNVQIGQLIYPFTTEFDGGVSADINVVNGETGPFVEAQLYKTSDETVLDELDPRNQIVGEYRFTTDQGVFLLEVKAKG